MITWYRAKGQVSSRLMLKGPNQMCCVVLIEQFGYFARLFCVRYMMARMHSLHRIGCENATMTICGLKTRRDSPSTYWHLLGHDLFPPLVRSINELPINRLSISGRCPEELIAPENSSRLILGVRGS